MDFIKPVFELRLLTMSGYMPDLVAVRVAGNMKRSSFSFPP